MKRMISILRYHADVYIHANRYFMPLVSLMVLLGGLYHVAPAQVVDSYAYSTCILFFIMVWMGFSQADVEDPVSEQVIILKAGSQGRYYAAGGLFLLGLSMVVSVFAVVFPLLSNALRGFTLYKRPVTFPDVLCAYALHCAVGFMGAASGALFHPRIVPDRKIALLFIFFYATVGFVKVGIHKMLPFTIWLTWVFPPLSEIAQRFAGKPYFLAGDMAYAVGISLAYGAVLLAVKTALLIRRRF